MQHSVQTQRLKKLYIYKYIHQCQGLRKEVQWRHLHSSWLNAQSGCADVFHWLFWETMQWERIWNQFQQTCTESAVKGWSARAPKESWQSGSTDESLRWMQNNLNNLDHKDTFKWRFARWRLTWFHLCPYCLLPLRARDSELGQSAVVSLKWRLRMCCIGCRLTGRRLRM